MKILKIFGCATAFFSAQGLAGLDLISVYPDAHLFNKSGKVYESYPAISGDIRYVSDLSGDSGEGYIPSQIMEVEGVVSREVFDHTIKNSAVEIFTNMRAELDREGFKVLYQCVGESCGDVAGWRLFFSSRVDGELGSQFYILARHPDKENDDWLVAFYVNEFSGIPRSIVHTVNTSVKEFENYEVDRNKLGEWLDEGKSVELSGLEFALDSAELDTDSLEVLHQLVEVLDASQDMDVRIEGHTDDQGSESYNKTLSTKRAEAVREYLINLGVNPERLSTIGYGESKPKVDGYTDEARSRNRRVEVVKVIDNG